MARFGVAPSSRNIDQVKRLAAFRAEYPGAEAWHGGGPRPGESALITWYGSLPLAEDRYLWTGPCNDLQAALDRLDRLTGVAAECAAIEADFPGWLGRLSADGDWRATRLDHGPAMPLTVDARDAASLRAAISEAIRVEAAWPGWLLWRRGRQWCASYGQRAGATVTGPDLRHVEDRIADIEQGWHDSGQWHPATGTPS